ncbi:MAG: hypothetical protein VKI42_08020 [Synechococcaceae cyanobacterium]|nr:hypothetical protein [Synechococcaceae cyanobacterium]
MPAFIPNRVISTPSPRVVVDRGLKPGRYRFRLVVRNAAGVPSQPSDWIVTIASPAAPQPDGPRPVERAPAPSPRFPALNRLAGPLRRLRDRFPL